MATITTRSGKGSPLTNNEVDANFTNLNTDKAELSGAAFTGAITTNSTIDGRDVATDGTKLDGIEASADVTDTTNVTAAGALMDSELTSIASVKALNQGVATTDSPTFAALTSTGEITANGGIALGDNDKATFGASDDLEIYHNGSDSFVSDVGTGDLYLQGSSNIYFRKGNGGEVFAHFADDGACKLRFDNSTKLATTATGIQVTGNISNASGDLTLDVAGDIILDADGADVKFKDGGTSIASLKNSGGSFVIKSEISDGGMYFNGNDGGSAITALTLDMSAAGAATFNSTVTSTGLTANVPTGNGLVINSADIATIKMKSTAGGVKNWGFATTNLAAGDFGIYASNSVGGDPITAGAAKLYFTSTGAATFNSTIAATGIDISGTATMDGLTVGGTSAYPTTTLSRDGGSAGTQGYLTTGFSAIGYSGGTGADTYMVSEHGFGFAVNAGTTALTITDTGLVGIGNAAPSTTLEVTGTGDAETGITATHARSGVGYTLLLNNTNNGANKGSGIKWQSGGFDTGAIITRSDATAASGDAPAYMTFHTSTDGSEDLAERARIDSSGRVGIGTSVAPHQKLTVTGVSAAVDGVLSNGILALTTGTGVIQDTRLLFGIVDDNYAWLQAADYGVAYRNIVMNPNGGNVLVGTTASNPTSSSVNVAGQEFSTTGGVRSTVASNAAATFNRKTDNGGIVLFRKDGTTVGSIGVEGGDALYIQSGTTSGSGLHFHPTSGTVRPARDGSTVDNAINLGTANRRFKDLYIAGLNVTASTYNKISSYFSGSYTSGFKFSDMNGGIWYDAASDDLTVSASHANSQLILESGGSERMRIDSSGNVGIGLDGGYKLDVLNTGGNVVSARFTSTATSSTEYGPLIVLSNDPNDTTRYLLAGGSSTVNRFVIYSNGNIKNQNNSYTGISDEKLKENIVDAGSQWDDIKALRVRKYSFKEENASEPTQIGVIAQEVEAAGMSGLVYETADQDTAEDGSFVDTGEVTKTMKYSILYMKAVKALQEAIDRIETLETRIAALEE